MGKLDDLMEKMAANMTGKLGMKSVDKKLLTAIGKSLGPSLYKQDSAKVACSDPKELDRIKKNFCIKKLGVKDTPKLDENIKAVCSDMGAKNRNKQRVVFYYLLVKKLKKSKVFA
jgi:Protein of unknown function (DUF2853)